MYHNLKTRDSLNSLKQRDIEKLWLPEVIYENTDQKKTTRLGEFGNGEWKTRIVVRREEENGVKSGLESVDETEVFSGFGNSLIMNQTYSHTFQCNYELSHYPFDTQVLFHSLFASKIYFQACSIDMAMGSLDLTTVTLIPDQLIMTQIADIPIFRMWCK